MPKNDSCLQRCPAEELSGTQIVLSAEEYGFLQRLRDFSFVNGGIPNNEIFIRKLAKVFHVSNYKFGKLWPILVKFFILSSEEIFVYPEDEEKRSRALVLISKRQIAGKKGAESRWGKPLEECSESTHFVMASAIPEPMANALAPQLLRGLVGGGGSSILIANGKEGEPNPHPLPPSPQMAPQPVLLSDDQYRTISNRAHELGLAKPSRDLAVRICRKFPDVQITEVVKHLVRWDGQTSCGLWDTKTSQDFEDEARRQIEQPNGRKPTQRELDLKALVASRKL